MLSSRAIAVQGVGFSSLLLALQGLVGIAVGGVDTSIEQVFVTRAANEVSVRYRAAETVVLRSAQEATTTHEHDSVFAGYTQETVFLVTADSGVSVKEAVTGVEAREQESAVFANADVLPIDVLLEEDATVVLLPLDDVFVTHRRVAT